ncbi:hypothetical protein AVEN_25413-1 [Araneus ventricosus]|uniref:Uncharacterized protein n=1 Tax=Araneus ventricosus TaxID=182803 RepID=A0A4Y2IBS1_ARAVE|nr:hypothetical protein AVEN_25413-1 [Araneus ventricosus]
MLKEELPILRKSVGMFLSHENIWTSNGFFEKQKLSFEKATLLPNDVLSWRCEFEICIRVLSGVKSKSAEIPSVVQGTTTHERNELVEDKW